MGHAEPTRHVSAAGSVRLRQPTPDLHGLQGGFVENVRKLERSAEELSAGGSDIGEEIRKMNELSRQSSLQSSNPGDISVIRPSVMERISSMQSAHRNSSRRSMDANSITSPGPYSPNRIVWSPTTTSMSASWSQPPPTTQSTATQSSRHSQLMQPARSGYAPSEDSMRSRDVSASSFARKYDEIAGEIQESLQHIPPSLPGDSSSSDPLRSQYASSERRRSIDTFQEAQLAFTDFDGVHFSPDTNEFIETDRDGNEIRCISLRSSSGRHSLAAPSLLNTSRHVPHPRVVPPPAEGMAYYPAPVPRTLNLPKRLSQLPAATVQSKRKTQLLHQLSQEAGAAAPWLSPGEDASDGMGTSQQSQTNPVSSRASLHGAQNHRMSSSTLNLPPHARAELFFKHRSVAKDVELTSDSAVATLDSILEASATAPVSAFIDHPFAGDVRKSVYAVDHKPQRTASRETANAALEHNEKKKRRSGSTAGVLRKIISSDDISMILKDGDLQATANTTPDSQSGPKKLQKRRSLGDDLHRQNAGLQSDSALPSLEKDSDENGGQHAYQPTDEQDIDDNFREEEAREDVEGDPVFVKPSTLLAELQVRKAQQKSRSRTAVTAFPNGMHSTLLELDAVQQVAQQRRKVQRIALAWEDPGQRALQEHVEAADEDVPLGMLYNGNDGLTSRRVGDGKDWDRPLGLMERRNLEDEEPLSSRRNRLKGLPARMAQPLVAPELQINGAQDDQGDEDETLAQRLKRMKAQPSPITMVNSSNPQEEHATDGFAADILSQFDTPTVQKNDVEGANPTASTQPAPSPDLEEETLGQRRARLQRERDVKVQSTNPDASFQSIGQPLGDARLSHQPVSGCLPNYGQNRMPSGPYVASTYNNGMGGMPFAMNPMLPAFGANVAPYGYGGMTAFAPSQGQLQQQWMNSAVTLPQMTNSMFVGNAYNPGMANGTYAAHAQRMSGSGGLKIATNDEQIPTPNRAVVDRWRLGVQ